LIADCNSLLVPSSSEISLLIIIVVVVVVDINYNTILSINAQLT